MATVIKFDDDVVVVNLINRPHMMPVDTYIFEKEIKDIFEFTKIKFQIDTFLNNYIGLKTKLDYGINQQTNIVNNNEKILHLPQSIIYKGKYSLVVYVTESTCATTILISTLVASCAERGIDLTLMHYSHNFGGFYPQCIFGNLPKIKFVTKK